MEVEMKRMLAVMVLAATGAAQVAQSPIVGAWHNTDAPPLPQMLMILSPDGYFARIAISPGRSKLKNDFDHRTREELMKQFGGFRAAYGTWNVAGNKLTLVTAASEDPAREGTQSVQEYRMEGNVLVLTSANGQREARFRRGM
jgi:hypothetical protein